jgi:hypothetical protein
LEAAAQGPRAIVLSRVVAGKGCRPARFRGLLLPALVAFGRDQSALTLLPVESALCHFTRKVHRSSQRKQIDEAQTIRREV